MGLCPQFVLNQLFTEILTSIIMYVMKKSVLKYIALCLAVIAFALPANAQNKKQEIKFTIYGNCEMCKERIEEALDAKGIIFAEWDKDTKIATVVYKTSKITEDEIHKLIADAGYSTDKVKANLDAYNKLDKCCQNPNPLNDFEGADEEGEDDGHNHKDHKEHQH